MFKLQRFENECVYVCMYVCMYVCIYIYIYIYIYQVYNFDFRKTVLKT